MATFEPSSSGVPPSFSTPCGSCAVLIYHPVSAIFLHQRQRRFVRGPAARQLLHRNGLCFVCFALKLELPQLQQTPPLRRLCNHGRTVHGQRSSNNTASAVADQRKNLVPQAFRRRGASRWPRAWTTCRCSIHELAGNHSGSDTARLGWIHSTCRRCCGTRSSRN